MSSDNKQCPTCGNAMHIDCHMYCTGLATPAAEKTTEQRIMTLEAEVRELRHLWSQNESWLVELKVRMEAADRKQKPADPQPEPTLAEHIVHALIPGTFPPDPDKVEIVRGAIAAERRSAIEDFAEKLVHDMNHLKLDPADQYKNLIYAALKEQTK